MSPHPLGSGSGFNIQQTDYFAFMKENVKNVKIYISTYICSPIVKYTLSHLQFVVITPSLQIQQMKNIDFHTQHTVQ